METVDLRNKVQQQINTADEKLLKMIKALVETYKEDEPQPALSEEDYQMIDKRRQAHLAGESKSLTWEEVKNNAREASK